jgi:hypothetical protein
MLGLVLDVSWDPDRASGSRRRGRRPLLALLLEADGESEERRMPVRLENLTDRPVLLTLSTGDTLRLSPWETSESLEELEVQASPKVEKLVARGVITVHEPRKRAAAAKKSETAKASQAGKGSAEEKKQSTK